VTDALGAPKRDGTEAGWEWKDDCDPNELVLPNGAGPAVGSDATVGRLPVDDKAPPPNENPPGVGDGDGPPADGAEALPNVKGLFVYCRDGKLEVPLKAPVGFVDCPGKALEAPNPPNDAFWDREGV
jgi:hypothetical protein